jgi:Ca-activated chloride channel family protein
VTALYELTPKGSKGIRNDPLRYAGFGQIVRGVQYTGSLAYDDVIALAQGARGRDDFSYRGEFINLARLAKTAQPLEPLPQ